MRKEERWRRERECVSSEHEETAKRMSVDEWRRGASGSKEEGLEKRTASEVEREGKEENEDERRHRRAAGHRCEEGRGKSQYGAPGAFRHVPSFR